MTCALCVVFTHGIIPPALAGLALSYATSVSTLDNDMCTVCGVYTWNHTAGLSWACFVLCDIGKYT